MSLFEEPRPEPQTEPEKPKRSKRSCCRSESARRWSWPVLVTSVLVASFGQGGKPSDNVADDPQQSEIVTPDDTETPTDETPDAETPSDDQQTPADNAETPSSGTTGGKQEINPSTGKDKYQTDPSRRVSPHQRSRRIRRLTRRSSTPAPFPSPARRSSTIWTR